MNEFLRWFSFAGLRVRLCIFRAVKMTKLRRFPEALSYWDEAVRRMPGHYQLLHKRGIIKLMLNDFEGAGDDFSESIQNKPGFAPAYAELGHALYFQGMFSEALEVLNTSLELNDSNPATLMYRGMTCAALSNPKGAMIDFNKSLRIDPDNSQAYFLRGKLKLEQDDARGALLDFNLTVKLDPSFQPAYIERGNAKLKLGSRTGAESDWKKARRLHARTNGSEKSTPPSS